MWPRNFLVAIVSAMRPIEMRENILLPYGITPMFSVNYPVALHIDDSVLRSKACGIGQGSSKS